MTEFHDLDLRRPADRAGLVGLVSVEEVTAHPDRRTLTVTFSGPPPRLLRRDDFLIEGGRRVVGLRVLRVTEERDERDERDEREAREGLEEREEREERWDREDRRDREDRYGHGDARGARTARRLRLTLDRPGDESTYRLRVRGPGFHGGRDRAEFTFRPTARPQERPAAEPVGAPPPRPAPAIDYLAKDYASFRRLLLERMSLTMPQWTERHVPDLWITLVEILAHVGDRLSYQQDAVATEAYLDTARLRTSVRRHARLVGYPMHDGCAARTVVCLEAASAVNDLHTEELAFTALPEDELTGASGPVMTPEALIAGPHPVYQPLGHYKLRLRPQHNRVPLWAWGQDGFPLPVGTTRAALYDPDRKLEFVPGDLVVIEETEGPDGGPPDPAHRQAVRLTRVDRDVDAYTGTPVLKIAWAEGDALTFPLTLRNPPDGDGRPGRTAVACGNAVLVEHGLENTWLPSATAEIVTVPDPDPDPDTVPDPDPEPDRGRRRPFTATLSGSPVTWSPPYPRPADVAAAQARRLLDLAAEARDRLRTIDATAPTDEDRDFLRALLGRSLAGGPDSERLVPRLRSRFDELLRPRLRQVERLVRRARSGYVLDPADVGEGFNRTWRGLAAASLDPANPALHGPAATALRPDPREALPTLRLIEEESGRGEQNSRGEDGSGRRRSGRTAKPEWRPRRDLLSSGPRDRHVTAETDDDGVLRLRFGDGRCGRAPQPGRSLSAVYRVGNGRSGNAGREAVNRIAARRTNLWGVVTGVRNPLPASGGTDPEPVAEVRLAAPRAPFRTLLRAVTAEDYATLAAQRPGVQRAAASLRWTGSWYEADVALDPDGATAPSPRLLEDVRDDLCRYRRIGHDVVTRPALLVPLDIALDVLVDPHHLTGHIRAALLRLLLPGRGSGGRPGFFDPSALTFGTPVRTSVLVALCMDVPGVRHAEVVRLRRVHDDALRVPDVPPSGELRMRPLEIPRLDGDVTRPENGRLTLRLRGGR
ncbi:putative baseplate assembly protein [Streptomyces sp. NPDC052610]|uniref:putative baseplate assembly protein n=1 Tax=Streptomyces sp. NPDC052610 TaxID=3154952 RepID=UPI00342077E7